jgi:D-3-phosphoglycerate dehydrogenase
LLEAWGARFNVQLEDHLAIFRYKDQPGMLGRLGTALGDAGINIDSAAVGKEERPEEAVLLVTTDRAVPDDVLATITASPDFHDAKAVSL